MNSKQLFEQLYQNGRRIFALVEGVSDEQARWKPDPSSWSILEVANHLYDEEREDFRQRLDIILHRPSEEWPPINPEGWVIARGYNQRHVAASLQNLRLERQASLAWLNGLTAPDWDARVTSPFGSMSAGELLASWAAHDTLHLRQLVELHHDWLVRLAEPYDTGYAGKW
jgi:uncharacterized damage-inducible protein DinB